MFDDVAPQVSLDRQIQAVEREIKQREYVYPRRVAAQKMTQKKADEEIGFMRAVLATLQRQKQIATAIDRILAANADYLAEVPNANVERDPVTLACDAARKVLRGDALPAGQHVAAMCLVETISRMTEAGKDAADDAATLNSLRERALQIVKGETP